MSGAVHDLNFFGALARHVKTPPSAHHQLAALPDAFGFQSRIYAQPHLRRSSTAVDRDQAALLLVILNQRRRLAMVRSQSLTDGLNTIIGPLVYLSAAARTFVASLNIVPVNMKDRATVATHAPSSQATEQYFIRDE
jgi:hypothetical protein